MFKKSSKPIFLNKNLIKFAPRMDNKPFENENTRWM